MLKASSYHGCNMENTGTSCDSNAHRKQSDAKIATTKTQPQANPATNRPPAPKMVSKRPRATKEKINNALMSDVIVMLESERLNK